MKLKTTIPTLMTFMALAIAVLAQTAASQTRDQQAIRAASEAWQRYVTTQDVDSIVALHTPDAVVMPSGELGLIAEQANGTHGIMPR